ncbi:MAG: terminase small subunit [Geminicoccaceae bacterium]
MGLTLKQERFCQEYIIDGNATRSALMAGYSEATSRTIASENLTKLDIRNRIDELEADRLASLKITQEKVILQTARLAMSDMRDYYHSDGRIKRIEELSDDAAAAITGIKVTKKRTYEEAEGEPPEYEEVVEFKLADKKGPLELLGKHHKLFTEKVEHTGANGTPLIPESDNELARRLAFTLREAIEGESEVLGIE